MSVKRWLIRFLEFLVVMLVISLAAGQIIGQPILLAFAETGSMEPTINSGDGFVAIPVQLAGPIEENNIIVFEAEEIQGGGLTTHRVVDETNRGYITKGDANPFTDQDSNEPPVKDAQIVSKALQIGGHVVVIPNLGTVVEGVQAVLSVIQRRLAILLGTRSLLGVQGLAYLFFGATIVWYLVSLWQDGKTKKRTRDHSRDSALDVRLVAAAFALLLVAGATAAMVAPAGTQEFGVVSAEFDSPGPRVIPMGESESLTYRVPNSGVLPVVTYLEPGSEGITIHPQELRVGPGETVNATVTLHAPPETGYYRRFLVEHRYLAVLPQPAIRALYQFHPWAPIVVIDALLAVPFYLLTVGLVGTGRLRRRSREDPSRVDRLVSRFT